MRKNRLFLGALIAVFSLLLFCVACGESEKVLNPSITLKDASIEINVDDEYAIQLEKVDIVEAITFTSTDSAVVSVDANGKVKALKEGETTIAISVQGVSATLNVKVVENRKVTISYTSNVYGFSKDADEVKYGTDLTFGAAPAVEGYTFLGYAFNADATEYISKIEALKENKTVYVLYEKNKVYYNVQFNLNDGTIEGTLPSGSTLAGTEIDLDSLTPTKENYEFLGWTTTQDSTSYLSGKVAINADTTFYAQFQIKSFKISYDLDGGLLYSYIEEADYNSELELPTPTKVGYEFKGWSLEKGSEAYITKLEAIAKDTTVYANWNSNTYTITYELDGGQVTGQATTIKPEETYALPVPTKEGFTFLGWTTSEYATTYITELKNISANTIVYAHFTNGVIATPETLAQVLEAAQEGDKITLAAGTYQGLVINKKVTIVGPNAGINPVLEERGTEASFVTVIEVTADDVTIDGIRLTENGYVYSHGVKNTTVKNVLVQETLLGSGNLSYLAPFAAVGAENFKVTCCKTEKSTAGENNRNMIFYGFNNNGLTITYCDFTGNKGNYNDGIKIANSNESVETYVDTWAYGIKGEVTIAHNKFANYQQYPIWFRNYQEGIYNVIDNVCSNCGATAGSHAFANWIAYSGQAAGEVQINFQYNLVEKSYMLVRIDACSTNTTCHINYNACDGNQGTYDIKNGVATLAVDAEDNFFDGAPDLLNVTVTKVIEGFDEVPTYASQNTTTYNLTYDLNEGIWPASYYTPAEIGELFIADFNAKNKTSLKINTLDTAHCDSSQLVKMLQDSTYYTKWLWLLTALYNVAGNGEASTNPATCDFSVWGVKGFYFANLYGFFNGCEHKESNLGTTSFDFSDPELSKPICALGPAKGVESGAATYNSNQETELSIPSKDGYAFVGWRTQEGKILKTIPAYISGDLQLTALWEKAVIAEKVVLMNLPVSGIRLYETLQLEWVVTPSNAYNQKVSFYSMDEGIFTITEAGLIKAVSTGTGKLRMKLEGNPDYVEYVDIVIWNGEYFDVSYDTNSYVDINKEIKLNAAYITRNGKVQKVNWTSLDENVATVSNGIVKGITDGVATIRATVVGDETKTFDFVVTVLSSDMSEAMKYVVDNHYSNAFTRYNLGIGAGTPVYYYDVVWSANNILFNDDLVINRKYYDKLPEGTKNNGKMSSVEFVTVHYTGNMVSTADADNNCDYFNNLEYQASIHYVTGRTNLTELTGLKSGYSPNAYFAFAGLNEAYGGWHASDSKLGEHKWLATGVKVAEGDPEKPVFSISANSKYTINGKETTISIPERSDGIKVTGPTFVMGGKTYNSINDLGLAWKVVDGEYYMGNTYWGTQAAGQTLCNIGGNYNSIGIESCVDMGSDLVHTWHVTAQLVADILVRYNLDITRVVGHHFFSGKDCPQPMLENNQEIWYLFLEMVQAEMDKLTAYKDATISAKAVKSDGILRDNGLLVQDGDAHCVTYEVTVKVGDKEEKLTLATCVESCYKCTCTRTQESLQMQGYPVI